MVTLTYIYGMVKLTPIYGMAKLPHIYVKNMFYIGTLFRCYIIRTSQTVKLF